MSKMGEIGGLGTPRDGSYLLPEGVDPSTVRYTIWDKVYNTTERTLNKSRGNDSDE